MPEIETPIYMQKSSDRLKDALRNLPPHPRVRDNSSNADKLYTEFDVLDSLHAKVYIRQSLRDTYSDRPCEGIGSYDRSFQHGIIAPDGEVILLNNEFGWRQALMEYHGGWIITIFGEQGGRPPEMRMKTELWASHLAGIEDGYLRSEIISKSLVSGIPSEPTFKDYLFFCHEVHREKNYHKSGNRILFV